ncbi:MAG TPA: alpha-amylase family protein [Pyrinomonadaceae bacterium]|nr:alpha-amylase family protein [Pyrinomonadaceae bacterium]
MIEELWYKNTVIYSLDLETFQDSDGDGVGDFDGLMRRLDYLDALDVDTVWLAPFHPSPNRDNGYDVADYYGVDPRHGTAGAFVEFMHEARSRGIRVIMDLVVNHTSDRHQWFQEARRDKTSKYRDWYVWSKKRPADWDQGMVFPGVEDSTWTYDKEAREYYFHRFYHHQPDLNTENPEVRAEIRRIMGYWLELGVAGFRVDAVPFIIETPGRGGSHHDLRFEYLREMRQFLQWRRGDAVLLGEANVTPEETLPYFGKDGGGIHMMFNFWVNQHLFYALASADTRPLAAALRATRRIPPAAQWAQFLRNHDELDLGRLSAEQRQEVFARFGPDPSMQLYERGIRRRLAPMLGGRRQLELAYSLLFSLPGTPVLRYGDEIAMGDDLSLNERDAVRTPMQWTSGAQAGFSEAEKLIHPVVSEGVYDYRRVNVAVQRRDPASFLNWTAAMIRLRKQCPEIGNGEWELLRTGKTCVLAMRYDWRGNSLVVVHNFDERPHEVKIKVGAKGGGRLVNLISSEECLADSSGAHRLALDAHGYAWFRVGDLGDIFRRTRA